MPTSMSMALSHPVQVCCCLRSFPAISLMSCWIYFLIRSSPTSFVSVSSSDRISLTSNLKDRNQLHVGLNYQITAVDFSCNIGRHIGSVQYRAQLGHVMDSFVFRVSISMFLLSSLISMKIVTQPNQASWIATTLCLLPVMFWISPCLVLRALARPRTRSILKLLSYVWARAATVHEQLCTE